MNQNNRYNTNNSIFYKDRLNFSNSLIEKANILKINLSESLSNGQCWLPITRKILIFPEKNMDDLYASSVT